MRFRAAFFIALGWMLAGFCRVASAHEAYVLDRNYFWKELKTPFSVHAFAALKSPGNLHIFFAVTASVAILLLLNFLFRESAWGRKAHAFVERLAPFGPLFVRAAIAAAFFYSALSWSFLGPELLLRQMPFPILMRIALFAASALIALGLFTEVAGAVSFVVFAIGFAVFGLYLFTYLNYFGEIIALLLFGTRKRSIDKLLFGQRRFFGLERWKSYETTIVRICYGIALSYAALTVKFLHPSLTVTVVEHWHLTQFHWLFPPDPLLVTFGAGIAELVIGLFIIFGFEMRLIVLISLFYITLSLMYFRELVWPHLMLYGISLNLIVQPEIFTLDRLFFWRRRV